MYILWESVGYYETDIAPTWTKFYYFAFLRTK